MFWVEALAALRESGSYRCLREMSGPQEAWVDVEGRRVLLLSSNNYLGLTTHPRVVEAAVRAVKEYGTGAGGSRLITGNMSLHRRLEEKIARFKGTEDAVVFATGYMANIGALTSLVGDGDLIASDQLNHASIIDGCRLSRAEVRVFRHNDVRELRAILEGTASYRRRLIVVDGVFSMDGDVAPLPELVELAERYDAMLMVDDAHATGVLGERGKGTVEHFGLEGRGIIQMGTLSKALASQGGYIAGPSALIDYLRNKARSFIYSTALAPAAAAAALAAIEVLEEEPEILRRLRWNVNYLYGGLKDMGYRVSPTLSAVIPVIIGDSGRALALAAALEERGVFVPAIRPPTVPPGTSRLRVTVMATHTAGDLDAALRAFREAGRELGII